MANVAIAFGALLIVLGLAVYAASGGASVTALIPAFLGGPLAALGLLGRKEALRRHAMHAAAALGLVGTLGALRGVVVWVLGHPIAPLALLAHAAMLLLCGTFLALCVRSFVRARRQPVAAGPSK